MDVDLLMGTVEVSEWTGAATPPESPPQSGDEEVEVERLVQCVTATCDLALPPNGTRLQLSGLGGNPLGARAYGLPPYIRRILHSYLGGRVLHLCEGNQGIPVTMEVACGVPQGFVHEPLLWNVNFDVVFRLPMPREATAIGYADDTHVVAEGENRRRLFTCVMHSVLYGVPT